MMAATGRYVVDAVSPLLFTIKLTIHAPIRSSSDWPGTQVAPTIRKLALEAATVLP
jgi:hypothetical protein